MTTRSEDWSQAAEAACKDADAFNIKQVVNLLHGGGVTIDEIPTMMRILKRDYPCLFFANVRDGLR